MKSEKWSGKNPLTPQGVKVLISRLGISQQALADNAVISDDGKTMNKGQLSKLLKLNPSQPMTEEMSARLYEALSKASGREISSELRGLENIQIVNGAEHVRMVDQLSDETVIATEVDLFIRPHNRQILNNGAIAFRVPNDDFSPRFEKSDLLFADIRHPKKGKIHIVKGYKGEGYRLAYWHGSEVSGQGKTRDRLSLDGVSEELVDGVQIYTIIAMELAQ